MWQTLSNGGPYEEKKPYLSTLPGVGSNPAAPATCPASEGRFQILRHFSKRCVHFIIITPSPTILSVMTAVRSPFPNGRSCKVGGVGVGYPLWYSYYGAALSRPLSPTGGVIRGVLGVCITNLTSPPHGGFLRFSSSRSFPMLLVKRSILIFQCRFLLGGVYNYYI